MATRTELIEIIEKLGCYYNIDYSFYDPIIKIYYKEEFIEVYGLESIELLTCDYLEEHLSCKIKMIENGVL